LLEPAGQQRVPLVERRGADVDRAAELGRAPGELFELEPAVRSAFGREELGAARRGERRRSTSTTLGRGLAREIRRRACSSASSSAAGVTAD
jgi:hypothetical protein